MDGPEIRPATIDDAPAIADIYRPIVVDTAISFELTPPDAAEFARRIIQTTKTHPWLVAEHNSDVVGYTYAGAHRKRAAYRFSVETTVYVAEAARRLGVARALYGRLFNELRAAGFRHAYAGTITSNPASVRFHESFGFEMIGVFKSVGFKFDQWHDVAWLHKPID